MKILAIHGSMHKGNTWRLTGEVIARLRAHSDVEIEEVHVADLELPFCTSCHVCFDKGEDFCPHRERLTAVTEGLKSCDGLIISGVVYSLNINAAVKNLIDHYSYLIHRPALFDKRGLVVTTTAGAADGKIAKYLKSVMGYWGISGVGRLNCKIRTVPFSLTDKQRRRTLKAADKLYNDIKRGKPAAPSFMSVIIYNGMRGMNTIDPPVSLSDQRYWRETGQAGRVYPRRVHIIKTATGAIICSVLRRIIKKTVKIERP